MNKGLLVFVYRNGPDCTNHGVTEKHDTCVLVGPGVQGPFEPSEDKPVLHLERFMRRWIACPEPLDGTLKGWMFGGNFVYTSDSRFPNEYPIPVYDRREF